MLQKNYTFISISVLATKNVGMNSEWSSRLEMFASSLFSRKLLECANDLPEIGGGGTGKGAATAE